VYAYVLMRWGQGAYTEAQIDTLVARGWITAEQAATIKATPR
jgi:hypothetical protein